MVRHIYAHFPFCEAKCHYCDFYSLGVERTKPNDPIVFEDALKMECQLRADLLDTSLDTLFFGGGTPSMTSYDSMSRALEPLWKKTQIHAETEWTLEANPSSIKLENMQAFRRLGINRISMGVQALKPELLVSLGRVHSREQAFQALDAVFSSGFTNVSVDLLCGVPNQTLDDLDFAMQALTNYPIQHLSCYLLTLPKHHKMFRDLPTENTQLEHLLFIHDWMTRAGFEHYEISNFARPNKKARHNLAYWQGQSYLGLGPSAHSYDANQQRRWKNVSSLHKYASILKTNELPIEAIENLTSDQIHIEKWMLALRLSDGVPANWLTQPQQIHQAQRLTLEGLLEIHPDDSSRHRLTPRGFALSDQIIGALI